MRRLAQQILQRESEELHSICASTPSGPQAQNVPISQQQQIVAETSRILGPLPGTTVTYLPPPGQPIAPGRPLLAPEPLR